MACHLTWAVIQSDRPALHLPPWSCSGLAPLRRLMWPQNVQQQGPRFNQHTRESLFSQFPCLFRRVTHEGTPQSPSPPSPSPLSLPHLLHTQSTHIVNCILYLVSVSLLSVKCKVNTRYFTQICQVFAQRVWARHTRGRRRDWAIWGGSECGSVQRNLL